MRLFKRKSRDGHIWYVRRPEGDISLRTPDYGQAQINLHALLEAEKAQKAINITVAECAELYRQSVAGRKTRAEEQLGSVWKVLKPTFGELHPCAINENTVRFFITEQLERVAPGTLWNYLHHLRRILNFASKRGHLGRGVQASFVEIPRDVKPGVRHVWLTRDEVRRLLDACASHPHLQLATLIMIATAQRYQSILELTWEQVDFDTGLIAFGVGYGNKRRAEVPMNKGLRAALLRAHSLRLTKRVVEYQGQPVRDIRNAFDSAKVRAGLPHVKPHDLRRSAARWLMEAGKKIEEVAELLAHTNIETTRRVYARFSPDYMRSTVDVLDVAIAEVPVGKSRTGGDRT